MRLYGMGRSISEFISVVIPVYNRETLVLRTLQSISEQKMLPAALILVDNNSTDNTLQTLLQWKVENRHLGIPIIVISEPTPGAAAARNRGLREVKTRFVSFFDSDDIMLPDFISSINYSIRFNWEADIIYWKCRTLLPNGKFKYSHFTTTQIWRNHIYHAMLATQHFCVRTSFMRQCHAWDQRILYWDDWVLGVRLLLSTDKLGYIPKTLVEIHPTPESITGTDFHSKAGQWEKAIDQAEALVAHSSHPDKQKLLSRINYRRAILAADYRHEGYPALATPLLRQALAHHTLNRYTRPLLHLLYLYRSKGGRGAAMIWR